MVLIFFHFGFQTRIEFEYFMCLYRFRVTILRILVSVRPDQGKERRGLGPDIYLVPQSFTVTKNQTFSMH